MGFDHVRDYDATPGNVDVIRVDGDLSPAAIRYWRKGNDLYVGIAGTGDGIVVENWFYDQANRVEAVVFADGTTFTADMLAAARYSGTAGADVLQGNAEANYLEGLEGNDTLLGGAGDDVLDGGAGNDTLYGGSSGYASERRCRQRHLPVRRGLRPGHHPRLRHDGRQQRHHPPGRAESVRRDVAARWQGLSSSASTARSDVLRVADWGLGAAYRIERVQFADGSVLEGAALVAPFLGTAGNDTLTGTADADLLMGLEGNDVLSGGAGNDVLDGGAGNDTLYGGGSGYAPTAGAGNDTYLFGRGYGQDTIYDYDTTAGNIDTIRLIDLNQSDVTLKREGKDFVISVNGTQRRAASGRLEPGHGRSHRARAVRRRQRPGGRDAGGAVPRHRRQRQHDRDGRRRCPDGAGRQRHAVRRRRQRRARRRRRQRHAVRRCQRLLLRAGAGNDTYVFGRGYGRTRSTTTTPLRATSTRSS